MKEEDLEEFAKEMFKDEQLDTPSSNFDYLVMQEIQAVSLKVASQPVLSPFKWILIGLFAAFVLAMSFFFNTGSIDSNWNVWKNWLSAFDGFSLGYTTTLALLFGGVFVIIQIVFLKKMHKKNLAD